MSNNKKIIACLLAVAPVAMNCAVFDFAGADGGVMIWPPDIHIQQTDQNAIVAWNGQEEILELSTDWNKPADSKTATLLHVVPLPDKPSGIKEGDAAVFDNLTAILNEKIAAMRSKNANYDQGQAATTSTGGATNSVPSVETVIQKTIGAHDITVVKVNKPEDFSQWIDGFASGKNLAKKQLSPEFKNGLQRYLQRGINYFAFDILDLSDGKTAVKPLVYMFNTRYFYFPLLISGISEIGDSQTQINLFLAYNKDWRLPQQLWPNYSPDSNYYVSDSNLDIDLTNDELKTVSPGMASLFGDGVKVRQFSLTGTLSAINMDLMLFPRILTSNLKIGTQNNDVKILQQLLINDGFWPGTGNVTGYFGPMTKLAVMKFQNAYKDEILKPLGLTQPTGFFGPYTRNYLNNNIFVDNEWVQNCGNGKCDGNENAQSCPWDCKPDVALTCAEQCLDADYGDGRCAFSNSAQPKCSASETDLGIGLGLGDCNLYGRPKTASVTCCCFGKNCVKEGGILSSIFDQVGQTDLNSRKQQVCCDGLHSISIQTNLYSPPQDVCVKIGADDTECKTVNGIQGWYYFNTNTLLFLATCPEKLVCKVKGNNCDWGTGTMTWVCDTESGGTFSIAGCNSICEPYGKCTYPDGHIETIAPTHEKLDCAVKNNGCDQGSSSMTYDCGNKGGGNFVIAGCDKLCQPYGKCVNPNGNTVNIPAQSP